MSDTDVAERAEPMTVEAIRDAMKDHGGPRTLVPETETKDEGSTEPAPEADGDEPERVEAEVTADDEGDEDDTHLTKRQRRQLRREEEAARLRAENEVLRRQLESKPAEPEAKPEPKADADDDLPKLEDYGNDFDAWERALIRHEARKQVEIIMETERKAEAEKSVAAQRKSNLETFLTKGAEIDKDFQAKIAPLTSGPDITEAMAAAIVEDAESGPALALHLASDPVEAKRIASLPSSQVSYALGRLAGRLSADPGPAPSTKAAQPPPRVRGNGGGRQRTVYDADKMSQKEYDALRDQEEKAARRW